MTYSLWHGFADMGAVVHTGPFVLTRGEGAYVFDAEDNRYLDATAMPPPWATWIADHFFVD